jgi:hypothetical protein
MVKLVPYMSNDVIIIHCKKDFLGCIDIREHVVNDAIRDGKSIVVTCGSFPGKSVYTPEELAKPDKISKPFKANHGKIDYYRLHSYPWKFE